MMDYDLLLQCYRSGQIDEASWQLHLQDDGLVKYIEGVKVDEHYTINRETR